jgi:cysteine desulfurase/selenocysteine lyase
MGTQQYIQSDINLGQLRQEIIGIDQSVPLLDGSTTTYVNLDNAASTPAMRYVKDKVDQALIWYSSVHRGSGFKSLLSTHIYEAARRVVISFVSADPQADAVIFCANTSVAVNTLATIMGLGSQDVVITTMMEHHSNDLPWRPKAQVEYVGLEADGSLALGDFERLLRRHAGKVKLVAVTGASNVSGFVTPIYDLAVMAHRYGARIFVDCAQLAPHRSLNMGQVGSPERLDFIALSAHKMYAPFGGGVLVGEKNFFHQRPPDYRGGGTIEIVTLNEVHWAEPPERNEVGSPNVIGAVALAASMAKLSQLGMDSISQHESELTHYALERLSELAAIHVYGSADPDRLEDRLGVIAFQVDGVPHGKVAAILSHEGGIAVRDGCFCAHPYVINLLGISLDEFQVYKNQALDHNRSALPGLVRVSFGAYNTLAEVDRLVEMLERIVADDYLGDYVVDKPSGAYTPRSFDPQVLDSYFSFDGNPSD